MLTHTGRGVFMGSATPIPKGQCPNASKFGVPTCAHIYRATEAKDGKPSVGVMWTSHAHLTKDNAIALGNYVNIV